MSRAGRVVADDLGREVEELAGLLAQVVEWAGDRAVFSDRWAQVAELAMGHDSVRRALRAAGSGL